jgi:hypothetical protein
MLCNSILMNNVFVVRGFVGLMAANNVLVEDDGHN